MCKYDDERICARLNFYDDILDSVSYYPNYKLSLEELIEVFGDPEYVSIQPWGAESGSSSAYPGSSLQQSQIQPPCDGASSLRASGLAPWSGCGATIRLTDKVG